MSVISTKVDGNSLSTVNGFYRDEAFNLGCSSTTVLPLSATTITTLAVTFANACNNIGIILGLYTTSSSIDRGCSVRLQDSKTITGVNTSTERITINSHGYADGDEVFFSASVTMIGGLSANTGYYIVNSTVNDFQVSLTPGGAAVNLTSSGSGTLLCWKTRASKTLTDNEIFNNLSNSVTNKRANSMIFQSFYFPTPYAVDTTAGKWRYVFFQTGTVGTLNLLTSDATNPFYVAIGDNQVTASSNNDAVIFDHKTTVDMSFTFKGVAVTGDATRSCCGVVCKSATPTPDNVANVIWQNPAVASYTFTMDGFMWIGMHSGVRAGTSTSRISAANAFKFVTKRVPTIGSAGNSGFSRPFTASAGTSSKKSSFFFYGEIPTYQYTTLSSQANTGQNIINTVDATGWNIGDTVWIGKRDGTGTQDTATRTISNISGTQITLSSNLAGANALIGAPVLRMNGYGGEISSDNNSNTINHLLGMPSNFEISGVLVKDIGFVMTSAIDSSLDDDANINRFYIKDCSVWASAGTSIVSFITSLHMNEKGGDVHRIYTARSGFISSIIEGSSSLNGISGDFNIDSCICLFTSGTIFSVSNPVSKLTLKNCLAQNSGNILMNFSNLVNPTIQNNKIWGCSSSNGGISLGAIVNTNDNYNFTNNYVDGCATGVMFANSTSKNAIVDQLKFGTEKANTIDIDFTGGAVIDYILTNPTGLTTISTTFLGDIVPSSQMRIVNKNGLANDDSGYQPYGIWQRCGAGLADSSVHKTGQSPVRFRSLSGTNPMGLSFDIPTGSLLGKAITVGIFLRINNSNYWAGSYQMPRVTVNYDNGSIIPGEAAQLASPTDYQYVHATFIPTTDYGKITITLTTQTDASGTDADVYFADWSGGFLVNNEMMQWSKGVPVAPGYSFNVNAATFWDAAIARMVNAGTIGKFIIKKLLTKIYYDLGK